MLFYFEEIIWKKLKTKIVFGEIKIRQEQKMNVLAEKHFGQIRKKSKESKENDFNGTEENIY